MANHHREEAEDLEECSTESSIEEYSSVATPSPPQFLPYESGVAAFSFRDNGANNIPVKGDPKKDPGDPFLRQGRSPRFWLSVIGLLLVVVAAVGGAVGVAMSGRSSTSPVDSQTGSVSNPPDSSGDANTTETGADPGVVFEEPQQHEFQETTEPTQTVQVGGVVNLEGTASSIPTSAPTSEVYDILLANARYHGVEFQDPTSYQSLAAHWVEETSTLGVHSPARLVQRYALACIYFATNGVENTYTREVFGEGNTRKWIDETGWLVDEDECDWYQITCDIEGWVTRIELFSNRLTGSFPPEVVLLRESLQTIDVFQNMIHNEGPAGNHFLGELNNLRQLFFARTYFEYEGIPTAIGALTSLMEFDCSYTLYNGPLDGAVFQSLSNLEYLHMGGNRYNSSIPSELAALPRLKYLYTEFANITGDLSFVKDMPVIVELWIDRNPMIGGTIPTEIGLIDSLESLSLTGCDLQGTLPTELANLRLNQFWAYNNSLTGSIPSQFGRLDRLVRLGLEGNNLEGTMPSQICANKAPNGLLMLLEADCEAGGKIQCDCCSCCGAACAGTTSVGV